MIPYKDSAISMCGKLKTFFNLLIFHSVHVVTSHRASEPKGWGGSPSKIEG